MLMRALLLLTFSALSIPPEQVVQKLQQSWDNTLTFQAKFKQVIQSKRLGTREENTGKVTIKKPGHLLWDSTSERIQQILNDNRLVVIQANLSKNNRSVDIFKDISGQISKGPLRFLSGKNKLKDSYQIKLLEEKKDRHVINLIPLTPDSEQLVAEVLKSSYLLVALISENSESRVRLDFSDIQTNRTVKDALFQYQKEEKDIVTEQ